MRVRATICGIVFLLVSAVTVAAQETLSERLARLEKIVSDLQDGAVIPFVASDCPEGWARFRNADGRFLIGTTDDVAMYGEPIRYGDLGGERYHTHAGTTNGVGGRGSDRDSDFTAAVPHSHSFETNANLHTPLYVGVVFCQLPRSSTAGS